MTTATASATTAVVRPIPAPILEETNPLKVPDILFHVLSFLPPFGQIPKGFEKEVKQVVIAPPPTENSVEEPKKKKETNLATVSKLFHEQFDARIAKQAMNVRRAVWFPSYTDLRCYVRFNPTRQWKKYIESGFPDGKKRDPFELVDIRRLNNIKTSKIEDFLDFVQTFPNLHRPTDPLAMPGLRFDKTAKWMEISLVGGIELTQISFFTTLIERFRGEYEIVITKIHKPQRQMADQPPKSYTFKRGAADAPFELRNYEGMTTSDKLNDDDWFNHVSGSGLMHLLVNLGIRVSLQYFRENFVSSVHPDHLDSAVMCLVNGASIMGSAHQAALLTLQGVGGISVLAELLSMYVQGSRTFMASLELRNDPDRGLKKIYKTINKQMGMKVFERPLEAFSKNEEFYSQLNRFEFAPIRWVLPYSAAPEDAIQFFIKHAKRIDLGRLKIVLEEIGKRGIEPPHSTVFYLLNWMHPPYLDTMLKTWPHLIGIQTLLHKETLLHDAIRPNVNEPFPRIEMIRTLGKYRPDPNALDNTGRRPLDCAVALWEKEERDRWWDKDKKLEKAKEGFEVMRALAALGANPTLVHRRTTTLDRIKESHQQLLKKQILGYWRGRLRPLPEGTRAAIDRLKQTLTSQLGARF
jgi:hypothetical protein